MKLRAYSFAAIAGSLLASAAFAQSTAAPVAQPVVKPAVAGETAKIGTKTTTKAADAKSEMTVTKKQESGGSTKIVKKHKHVANETTAKQAGASATIPEAKSEATKDATSAAKAPAKETVKAGAGPTTSGK